MTLAKDRRVSPPIFEGRSALERTNRSTAARNSAISKDGTELMATSRRIFLQVLGSGAAVSLDFACGPGGIGGPEGLPDPMPGSGGGYPGPAGTGGSGAGGRAGGSGGQDNGSGGAGGDQGTGGIDSEPDAGFGGAAGQGGAGGAGGQPADSGTGRGGRPVHDAGRVRDAG